MKEGRRLIVSGEIDSGKSSLCSAIVESARARGWEVAGLVSHAVVQAGEKIGFEAERLPSGERRVLALRPSAGVRSDGPATKGWRFDGAVLAWCNQGLEQATPCDLLVVDELGPLEWVRGEGLQAGLQAVDGAQFRLALIVVRPWLVPRAIERWPDASVVRLESPDQVAPLADSLLKWIERGLPWPFSSGING
jgi:nucleoside-triphosphatase THEP1